MSLLNNPKKARYVVAGFVLLLLAFAAYEANAELAFEAGVPFISTDRELSSSYNIILSEIWDDKWQLGFGLVADQEWKDRRIRNNMVAFGQRTVRGPKVLRNVKLGFGFCYLSNLTVANGSKLNYILSLEISKLKGHWFGAVRHCSNGGSSPPNPGWNLLNVGYRF